MMGDEHGHRHLDGDRAAQRRQIQQGQICRFGAGRFGARCKQDSESATRPEAVKSVASGRAVSKPPNRLSDAATPDLSTDLRPHKPQALRSVASRAPYVLSRTKRVFVR